MIGLLVELENKVEQIEKEKYISLSNVNSDLLEHLNYAKKELSSANGERKRNLKIDILKLKEDIKYNETEINRLFNNKKIVMYKDTMKIINNEMKKIKNDLVSVIREKSDELRNLKNEIVQANNLNNFILVEKLSLDARKLNTNISCIREKFQETNKLINYIEKTLGNIDNLSFEQIVSEFENNKDKITEIGLLSNEDSTEKNKNKKEKELKNKINLIKELLEKTKTNNDEKDLESANKLIKELPDSLDKKALQQKAIEVKEAIEKNKQELEIKNKINSIEELLEKAKKDNSNKELDKACELINQLPEYKDKNDLQQKAAEINELIKEKNREAIEALFEEFKITVDKLQLDFEKYKLEELKRIIDSLKKKANIIGNNLKFTNLKDFKQSLENLNSLIFKYNVKEKEENRILKSEEILDEKVEHKTFKEILTLNANRIKDKIVKKTDDTFMNTISVLCAKNKLSKLKYKLYKNGVSGLGKKKKNYDASNKIIAKRLLKYLLNKEIGLKEKCKKWLELISIMPNKLKIYKTEYEMKDILIEAKTCFDTALDSDEISREEYEGFVSIALDICRYREEVDDFYVLPNGKEFITYVDKDSVIKEEKQIVK